MRPTTSEVTELAVIPVAELEGHPKALAFWPEGKSREEAAALMADSVARDGIRQPLTVCRRPEGGWWVIDGCTRLAAARSLGLEAAPCREISADERNVDDEIFIANLVRSSASSGLRIMRYLEKHRDKVLAAAIVNADSPKSGALGGRGNKRCLSETAFSAVAIAERLKVCREDVRASIELLRCRTEGLFVEAVRGNRNIRQATEEEREAVEEAYRRVLDGTPPRRWLPAAAGRAATADKARPATDWYSVGREARIRLLRAFEHLDEMHDETRAKFIADWMKALKEIGKTMAEFTGGE